MLIRQLAAQLKWKPITAFITVQVMLGMLDYFYWIRRADFVWTELSWNRTAKQVVPSQKYLFTFHLWEWQADADGFRAVKKYGPYCRGNNWCRREPDNTKTDLLNPFAREHGQVAAYTLELFHIHTIFSIIYIFGPILI